MIGDGAVSWQNGPALNCETMGGQEDKTKRTEGTKKKALKNLFKAFVLIPAMTYSPTQFPGQYHWR